MALGRRNDAEAPIWIAAGVRTPFARVDGGLAKRDAIELGVPVLQAMAGKLASASQIDCAAWGTVIPNLRYANIARETWLDAKLDPTVPTWSVVMQCSTSMMAAFDVAGALRSGRGELGIAGGTESMTHIQVGLTQPLSDGLRRVGQAKTWKRRAEAIREIDDVGLERQSIKNRTTGKSMGEHSDETALEWKITRADQDIMALEGHQRVIAARERGFFDDLVIPIDGVTLDEFPRKNSSLEALAKLKPAFHSLEEGGTATAGNSSPLTDGAAAIWVATEAGLARLPEGTPRAKLVDYELGSVDIDRDGLLMAPAFAIPRLLARNGLRYEDVDLWEIHEAFTGQVLYQLAALDSKAFVGAKARVEADLGVVPRGRINPNGGSVALGHPFGATGARILSQATKELAAMPRGTKAIVSICADGGLGTVALLENAG